LQEDNPASERKRSGISRKESIKGKKKGFYLIKKRFGLASEAFCIARGFGRNLQAVPGKKRNRIRI
jgi:hypothetical protein